MPTPPPTPLPAPDLPESNPTPNHADAKHPPKKASSQASSESEASSEGGGTSGGGGGGEIPPDKLEQAQRLLDHQFADISLLHEALTHASLAQQRVDSNERMEFFGDAILGMVVCEHLYHRFPDLLEGEMTKIKSTVVSRRTCAKVSETLGLTDTLRMGKGMTARATVPSSVSAAALESVVAAIYLDAGLDAARAFILKHLDTFIVDAAESTHQSNYKSALQQFAQKHLPHQPTYILIDEKGPDHAKAFSVAIEIANRRFAPCWANAKKEAEQQAARAALEDLGLLVTNAHGKPHLLTGNDAANIADSLDFPA